MKKPYLHYYQGKIVLPFYQFAQRMIQKEVSLLSTILFVGYRYHNNLVLVHPKRKNNNNYSVSRL